MIRSKLDATYLLIFIISFLSLFSGQSSAYEVRIAPKILFTELPYVFAASAADAWATHLARIAVTPRYAGYDDNFRPYTDYRSVTVNGIPGAYGWDFHRTIPPYETIFTGGGL